jgi:uncharacterized membrane protein
MFMTGRWFDGAGSEPPSAPGPLAESTRVEAFSDGVFAIAITLLVLDLKAPASRGAVLHDLLAEWPAYVAYLASFGYIGVIWVNHHYLFTRIAFQEDRCSRTPNMEDV